MAGRSLTTRGPAWYWKRLRAMSATEILHRFAEQGTHGVMWLEHRAGRPAQESAWKSDPAAFAFCRSAVARLPALAWDDDSLRRDAGDLLDGQLTVLGASWQWTGDDSWHAAPDTGRQWPRGFFLSIPYRPGNPFGDIRIAWEPARLQQLVALARIAVIAPALAARAKECIAAQLASWLRANPLLTGIHYISAMECALRILAVCHAADLVRHERGISGEIATPLVTLVNAHARFVHRRISRFSSANNHAVAEAAGLVYAGHLFPELPSARNWLAAGLGVLAQEAHRQILPDGCGAEQTFWYLRFVAHLYLLVANLLEGKAGQESAAIQRAGERASEFLRAVTIAQRTLPDVGDRDDGFALSRYAAPGQDASVSDARAENAALQVFPDGGYSSTRSRTGDVTVLLDHGPLGLAPTYVHGHADALSVCAWAGGNALLIDPGTGTYNGDPRWRAYFRGTAAHNTVVVDGLDQAQQETSFMWSRPYHCALRHKEIAANGDIWLVASHDGYRERCGVLHIRGLALLADGTFVVVDRLAGSGRHTLDLHWHTPVDGRLSGNTYSAATSEFALELAIEGGIPHAVRGREDPPLGWRSPTYEVRLPVTTLVTQFSGTLPHEFVTVVSLTRSPERNHAVAAAVARIRELIHASVPN